MASAGAGAGDCGVELSPGDCVYLEQLKYLKEINDQQRLLSRAEGLVERSFEGFKQCSDLHGRCKKEMELLKDERKKLMDRIVEIDRDIDELSGLAISLERECSFQCSTSALPEYYSLLQRINSLRKIGQLPPFKECHAYEQLNKTAFRGATSERSLQLSTVKPPVQEVKAGKSHKQCPGCFQQVSRNATFCPHCKSACTKNSWRGTA